MEIMVFIKVDVISFLILLFVMELIDNFGVDRRG